MLETLEEFELLALLVVVLAWYLVVGWEEETLVEAGEEVLKVLVIEMGVVGWTFLAGVCVAFFVGAVKLFFLTIGALASAKTFCAFFFLKCQVGLTCRAMP